MQYINKRLLSFFVAILCFLLLNGVVLSQGSVITTIPIQNSSSLIVNPATNTVFASSGSMTGETLAVIDGTTNTVTASIPTGTLPFNLAVNPNTNRVYLPDQINNQVIVVDGSDNSILTTIPVGSIPWGIAANPTTNRIYVTELTGHNVEVIDGSTNAIIDTIPFGHNLSEIAVNPVSNRIYVADDTAFEIVVIDGTDDSIITTIDADENLGSSPNDIAINDFTNQIYLSIVHPGTFEADIVQIDGDTNLVVDRIPLADSPNGLAVNSIINHIYVATSNQYNADGKTYIIDGTTNSIIDTIAVGKTPYDIDADPVTSRVYIVTVYGDAFALDTREYGKIHAASREGNKPQILPNLFAPILNMPRAQSGSGGDTIAVIQDIRPVLIGPKRNYFRMATPTLTWNRIDWAIGYEIQVDDNLDFKSPEYHDDTFDSTVLSTTTSHLDDGIYYWHVRAKRANGTWAYWSVTQVFEVNA